MSWQNLKDKVEEELAEIKIDSDIQFSDDLLQERTDRPILVRDGVMSLSRPVTDFSEDERELVKWGVVSDILAYEAGLESPGTFSQTDWDNFNALYGEQERGEVYDFVPGSDDSQKRRNGSLLMRQKGEKMEEYSDRLESRINVAESYTKNALEILFGSDQEIFEPGSPQEYNDLIDLVIDNTRRRGSYDEIVDKTSDLADHSKTTEGGRKVLNRFKNAVHELEVADQLVEDATDQTKEDIENEYRELLENSDSRKMAASLLYLSASLGGSKRLTSANRQIPENLGSIDHVTNGTLEQSEYLRDIAAEKYFSEEQDLENAFTESVKEFLND